MDRTIVEDFRESLQEDQVAPDPLEQDSMERVRRLITPVSSDSACGPG